MELNELLKELKSKHIKLFVKDGRLCFKAPKGLLTDELKAGIRQHKTLLIDILSEKPESSPPLDADTEALLTIAQRQIWLGYHSQPSGVAAQLYHVSIGFDIEGAIEVSQFQNTMQKVVHQTASQFDALQFRFYLSDQQEIVQAVQPFHPSLPIKVIARQDIEPETDSFIAQPFDLLRGRPHRAVLLQWGDARYRFIWCFHHIICDGVSLAVIAARLKELFIDGTNKSISNEPTLDFLAYAFHLDQNKNRLPFDQWIQGLLPIDPHLGLSQAPHNDDSVFADDDVLYHEFSLDEQALDQVMAIVRPLKVSLFEYLLGCYTLVICHFSRQTSLCVEIPEAGRPAEQEKTVGLFAHYRLLGLTVDVAHRAEAYFQTIALQIRQLLLMDAVPVEQLMAKLNVPRGRDDYRQIGFSYFYADNNALGQTAFTHNGMDFTPFTCRQKQPLKPLNLNIFHDPSRRQLLLQWQCQTSLIPKKLPGLLFDAFHQIVTTMDPSGQQSLGRQLNPPYWQQTLSEVYAKAQSVINKGLSTSDKIHESHKTNAPGDKSMSLGINWLLHQRLSADIAVYDGNAQISYHSLVALAEQAAQALLANGVGPGHRIYIDVTRSVESVALILGLWLVGAVYCPVNRQLPGNYIRRLADNNLLISDRIDHFAFTGETRMIALGELYDFNPIDDSSLSLNPYHWQTDDGIYQIQTSGTSGVAKSVMITYGNLQHYLKGAEDFYQLSIKKHVLYHTAISFDVSLFELLVALYSGGSLFIVKEGLLDAGMLNDICQSTPVNLIALTASHWHRLAIDPTLTLDQPVHFVVGAEPMNKKIVQHWFARFGSRHAIANLYGPTETTIGIIGHHLSNEREYDDIPIGRPFNGCYAFAVDRYGKPVAPGAGGELVLVGPTVSPGYQNGSGEQNNRFSFIASCSGIESSSSRLRIYYTGDRVRQNQAGEWIYLDRMDRQIKWRGYRIELLAIERCIEQLDFVDRCVVIPVKDGDLVEQLIAVLLIQGVSELNVVDDSVLALVRQTLQQNLPAYMLPTLFLQAGTIPVTLHGKMDTARLVADAEQWLEGQTAEIQKSAFSPTEQRIHRIWSDLLASPAIHPDSNFFDLGGHSLQLLDALQRLRQSFNVDIEITDLFEYINLRQLAGFIEAKAREACYEG